MEAAAPILSLFAHHHQMVGKEGPCSQSNWRLSLWCSLPLALSREISFLFFTHQHLFFSPSPSFLYLKGSSSSNVRLFSAKIPSDLFDGFWHSLALPLTANHAAVEVFFFFLQILYNSLHMSFSSLSFLIDTDCPSYFLAESRDLCSHFS